MTSIALAYQRSVPCAHCRTYVRVLDMDDDDGPPVYCNACYEAGDADMVDVEAANDGEYPRGQG